MKLSDRKKLDILKAARIEFEKNGFEGTSMDLISKTAQVSKPTVYNHFENKEILFESIVQNMFESIFLASEYKFDETVELRIQLLEIAHQEIQLFESTGFIPFSKVVMAEAIRNPLFSEKIMCSLSEKELGIEVWLKSAKEAGVVQVENTSLAA
jgi:TetR/AcrR family transcriptional regulator of autoinduction and epiphytic fitness